MRDKGNVILNGVVSEALGAHMLAWTGVGLALALVPMNVKVNADCFSAWQGGHSPSVSDELGDGNPWRRALAAALAFAAGRTATASAFAWLLITTSLVGPRWRSTGALEGEVHQTKGHFVRSESLTQRFVKWITTHPPPSGVSHPAQ